MKIPQAGFYPFWFWNGVQEESEISRQIIEIADSGCKGVVIHARTGNQIPYLSDRWLELFAFACEECARRNLKVWIYDEDGFPSGNAGKKVQQNRPDLRQKSWSYKNENGKLEFSLVYNDEHVDTLHPDSVKEFIRLTHEVYKKHLGHLFGNTIEAIYTDDESFLVWYTSGFVWTEAFDEEFRKNCGRDFRESLPALLSNMPDSAEIRKCYSFTAQKLFLENFILPQQKWCHENGLIYTGHLSGDEGPRCRSVKNFTSAEPYYKSEDIPAIDDYLLDMRDLRYLHRPYTGDEYRLYPCGLEKCHPLYTFKLAASAGNRSGINQVSSEIWAFLGWNMPPEFLEGQTLFEIVMGQTLLTPHAFYYTLKGEAEQDCPPTYFIQQPYWPMLKKKLPVWTKLAERVANSQAVADTLLIVPDSLLELQDMESQSYSPDSKLAQADLKLQMLILELMRRHIGFDLMEENQLSAGFGAMEYKRSIHADFAQFDELVPLWDLKDSEEILIQCRQNKDNSKWYLIQNLSGEDWMPSGEFPAGMHVLFDPLRERIIFRGERFPENFRLAHGELLLLFPDCSGAEIDFTVSEFCIPQEKKTVLSPGVQQLQSGVHEYVIEFTGKYSCVEIAAQNGVMEISVNDAPPQVLWGNGRLAIAEWCSCNENRLEIRFANSAGLIYGDPTQKSGISSVVLCR